MILFDKTDMSFSSICAGGARQLAGLFGINLYQYTEDRRILEKTIFPYFSQTPDQKILFVGCDWYTRHYPALFAKQKFWTLDVDPRRARYGAARHIEDRVENISSYFATESLDAIFCNGLLGWGLNERLLIEQAFNGCVDALAHGGVFILGWNDVEGRRPCRLEDCSSLRRLQPFTFPPLQTTQYQTRGANRHTYNFYVKT